MAVSVEQAIGQVQAVLREAFEGSQEMWSYFTDQGAEGALLATLARLGAADASRPVGSRSVAAHTHHVAFSLQASAKWIRGDRSPNDWTQSWTVSTVDDGAWAALQEKLRGGYADLRRAIESGAASGEEAFGGAVAVVAHVAYHLGAIKQKLAALSPAQ
jgi:hypothetical protein